MKTPKTNHTKSPVTEVKAKRLQEKGRFNLVRNYIPKNIFANITIPQGGQPIYTNLVSPPRPGNSTEPQAHAEIPVFQPIVGNCPCESCQAGIPPVPLTISSTRSPPRFEDYLEENYGAKVIQSATTLTQLNTVTSCASTASPVVSMSQAEMGTLAPQGYPSDLLGQWLTEVNECLPSVNSTIPVIGQPPVARQPAYRPALSDITDSVIMDDEDKENTDHAIHCIEDQRDAFVMNQCHLRETVGYIPLTDIKNASLLNSGQQCDCKRRFEGLGTMLKYYLISACESPRGVGLSLAIRHLYDQLKNLQH